MILKPIRPTISYYGSKWSIIKHYPEPQHDTIIEPFAGSASYSHHYWWKNVELYDINPRVVGVWEYLIKSKPEDILALPDVENTVDELNVCQEAKWLIGYWLQPASVEPMSKGSTYNKIAQSGKYAGCVWGALRRKRIAYNLKCIKHWRVRLTDYNHIENKPATWFIDPPYDNKAGRKYTYNGINYNLLSDWVYKRKGIYIVCDNAGAKWMPFEGLTLMRGRSNGKTPVKSEELIYTNYKPSLFDSLCET